MFWFYILISVVLMIFLLVCAVSLYFFNLAIVAKHATIEKVLERGKRNPTYSKYYDRIVEGSTWIKNYPHKRVEISSYDNLKLCASVFEPATKTKNCMLLVHGWSSHPIFDFSCVLKKHLDSGTNVILIEQRGHGDSEGKYTCFGVKERYDVLSWANYIIDRYGDDCKIILDGISMGASTVMMTAGISELPKNIVAIIADCGFTCAYDQFAYLLKLWYKLPPFPLLYTVNVFSRLLVGFGFKDVSTTKELQKSNLPILFLHGEDDDFVPAEFSRLNYNASASQDKNLVIVPGAKHGTSYMTDEEKCNRLLEEFLQKYFHK